MRAPHRPPMRRFAVASVLLSAALALGALPAAATEAPTPAPTASPAPSPDTWFADPDGQVDFAASAARAYSFLDARVDEYCSDDGLCLPRSYEGGFFTTEDWDFTSSFLYDDALIVMAYAARGLPDDIRRARAIGDAMLFVQEAEDGRTRVSYEPAALAEGRIEVAGGGTFTGNQAWVGMALTRLHDVTGDPAYLAGALRLGAWIQDNTSDSERAPAGYTGGEDAEGTRLLFKSTEHNADVAGFFTQLAQATGDAVWARRASVAAGFVAAMQREDGHLATGTHTDGSTINDDPIPEDPQTWSVLATRDPRYLRALDWTVDNLLATDGAHTGPSFSDSDVSKVWFEGSAHLALALRLGAGEDAGGDDGTVRTLLASIEHAQRKARNGDGAGIVATSRDGLDSGFGDEYHASLHTGATAWYLLAIAGSNPFRLAADDGAVTPVPAAIGAAGAAGDLLAETGALVPRIVGGAAVLAMLIGAVLLIRHRRRILPRK